MIRGILPCPLSGKSKVKDLTINEAREKIEKSLSVYLNNISVMFVLSAIRLPYSVKLPIPGQHSFFDEKVTVFQALGFAGGTSTYGDLTECYTGEGKG